MQFQHHACLRCGEMVQQDPLHLRLHLLSHGLNLAQYTNLLEAEGSRGSSSGEGEVVSSASSTLSAHAQKISAVECPARYPC